MESTKGHFYLIEDLRLYSYPKDYTVVWRGNITIDSLFDSEAELFAKFKSQDVHDDLVSQGKEIEYLTEKEHFVFKLNKATDKYHHSDFIKRYGTYITFARIDNVLFTIWADIYRNNGEDKRSEVGLKLTSDITEDVLSLYQRTNFKKKILTNKQRIAIVEEINSKYRKHLHT